MIRTSIIFAGLMAATSAFTTAQAAPAGTWVNGGDIDKCYAFTNPTQVNGNLAQNGEAYISLNNDKSEGVKNAVIIASGSDPTDGFEATIDIDGKKFEALTFNGAAFVASGEPEADLIQAMRKGNTLKVQWTAAGEITTHTYTLKGFTAAYNQVDKTCG